MISIGSIYTIRDKYNKVEQLTCSLPVTRNKIVYSKYLNALIITIIGFGLWSLNAFLADLVWVDAKTQLEELFNWKILFSALFFTIVAYSVYLPSVFIFKQTGMIIMLFVSVVISVFLTANYLIQQSHPFISSPETADIIRYSILAFFMVILPVISIMISKNIYKHIDI